MIGGVLVPVIRRRLVPLVHWFWLGMAVLRELFLVVGVIKLFGRMRIVIRMEVIRIFSMVMRLSSRLLRLVKFAFELL